MPKKQEPPAIKVRLAPRFAEVAMAILDKVIKGEQLSSDEREGAVLLNDAIRHDYISFLRGIK